MDFLNDERYLSRSFDYSRKLSQSQQTGGSKTRSITFRLDPNIVDELQREADQREISLNVLVNQVLRRYCSWDRYESKIGVMPVPKIMLSDIMDKAISIAKQDGMKEIDLYRDRIIKEAALSAFSLIKDSVLFMKQSYNLWTVLAVLQEYMRVSNINSDHRIEGGGRHVFIIQHELGENWSLFTKELFSRIFEDLANVRADVDITSNSVIAKIVL
jgi:hypothetical protein